MTAQAYSCPSCGAPLTVENRFSKLVICQYCGQNNAILETGLNPTGKTAKLADFGSILKVGASGKIRNDEFRVLGRLRYQYEDGFWDEWLIRTSSGKMFWLQEDEGEFTAFEKEAITSSLPPFEEVGVGSTVSVNNRPLFVTEKNESIIAGAEGEINFTFQPGEKINYVDGNAGGVLASIEFSPSEIHLSKGSPIAFDEITVTKNG